MLSLLSWLVAGPGSRGQQIQRFDAGGEGDGEVEVAARDVHPVRELADLCIGGRFYRKLPLKP
jgi:hypothetical protein